MKLKLLDLFSGIGGFSLGLESTGYFETIAFVEKDKFCQQVLKKNFKDIPIESEVRDVKGDRYAADIITGGFPCQPFSLAGKRKGTDDDRYLWDETIRIIRESKCRWFIGENVEGIINIQEGVVLRQVCDDLEKEGFEVQCLVIPASGIGAWHQRKRVWIIAQNPNNSRCKDRTKQHRRKQTQSKERIYSFSGPDIISHANISTKTKRRQHEIDEKTSPSRTNNKRGSISNGRQGCFQSTWKSKDVPNTDSTGSFEKHSASINREIKRDGSINESGSRRDVVSGEKTWWEAQSDICRNVNGISYELDKDRANRIKALGNSIVPLIARELGIAIMKAEQDG